MMLIIAHRGSSGTAPENTMAAFRKAVHDGAMMIELDVRLSADGEVVVIHDRRLRRVSGKRGRVRDLPCAALKALDVGSYFDPAFSEERIPLLREVLRMVPGEIGLNIEVKTDGDRVRNGLMSSALGDLITRSGKKRTILVSSFDHRFLKGFHGMFPAVPLGVLYLAVRDMGRSPVRLAQRVGARTFVCSRSQVRKRAVLAAHRSNLQVLVYGVRTLYHLAQMKRFGADGVITDYPARLSRAVVPQ